jgi:hypothetical protein
MSSFQKAITVDRPSLRRGGFNATSTIIVSDGLMTRASRVKWGDHASGLGVG